MKPSAIFNKTNLKKAAWISGGVVIVALVGPRHIARTAAEYAIIGAVAVAFTKYTS